MVFLGLVRFRGIFAPAERASLSAIATAYFLLFTVRPDDDLSEPFLYSRITLPTFFRPPVRFFRAIESSFRATLLNKIAKHVPRTDHTTA